MKHIRKIELDIDREYFEKIPAVQYDNNSRYLQITLMSGVGPLDITNHTVIVSGYKPDGEEIFNGCRVIDGKKGIIEVHMSEQLTAADGVVDANIQIYGVDKSLLSTQQFHIYVGKGFSTKNVTSSTEYEALVDAIAVVTGIDNKVDKAELEVERQRINNLARLSEGSTSGDAELMDGRVGDNGKTYRNIGEATRKQFRGLKKATLGNEFLDLELHSSGPSNPNFDIQSDLYSVRLENLVVPQGNNGITYAVPTNISTIRCKIQHKDFGINSGLYYFKGDALKTSYKVFSRPVSSAITTDEMFLTIDWDEVRAGMAANGTDNLRLIFWNGTGAKLGGFTYVYDVSVNGYLSPGALRDNLKNFDGSNLKDGSVSSSKLENESVQTEHLSSRSVTNDKIYSVDVSRVVSNLCTLNAFTHWGGPADNLVITDKGIEYNSQNPGDVGVLSNIIDLFNVDYKSVFITIDIQSTVPTDISLFTTTGGFKCNLEKLTTGQEDTSVDQGYVTFKLEVPKETIDSFIPDNQFKLVVALHQPGVFRIRRMVVNTTGSSNETLQQTLSEIYDSFKNPNVYIDQVKNANKTITTASQMSNWGTPSKFIYDSSTDVIQFAHNSPTGNSGIITPYNFMPRGTKLRISGTILALDSGAIDVHLAGKSTITGKTKYYSFKLLSKIGHFDFTVDVDYVINQPGRDPLDLSTIQVLFGNSGQVSNFEVKNLKVINNTSPFNGNSLADVLNNLEYKHIKCLDTVFASIFEPSTLGKWAGGSYSINGNSLTISHLADSGNGGVRTMDITSKTNFLKVEGAMSSITKHTNDSAMCIYICGTSTENKPCYISVKMLTSVTTFNLVIDLNYHAVYNKLDLSKPVYVLFGSISKVDATFTDIKVYENEMSSVGILGKDLGDTVANIDNEIKSIKSDISGLGNTDNVLTSPNGNRFVIQVANDGSLSAVSTIPNKILFIGNSLLNGFGTFGMCASDSKNDYYYHVTQYLKQFKPDGVWDKIHGAPWEQAETKSVADKWVNDNIKNKATDYDLVIVQLGDNVNNEARNELFKTSCKELLQAIRSHMPKARVVWAGEWYATPQRQSIIEQSCKETGSIFIDITDLNGRINQAAIGDIISHDNGTQSTVTSSGVASHPGNKGMKAIADRLIERLF